MSDTVNRAQLLAARHELLLLRVHEQRAALALQTRGLAHSAGWVERGLRAWGYVRTHPWVAAVPLVAVAVIGPRRVTRVLARVITVWRVVRSLRVWMARPNA
ncbi:MAG TPA: YqjK family protein [Albitalea sp.]|nr:YqjK family protein [Albitalea sp.]HJW12244.1 YqjK family protein [Albitalea sp.]